jgi:hypothetical protein
VRLEEPGELRRPRTREQLGRQRWTHLPVCLEDARLNVLETGLRAVGQLAKLGDLDTSTGSVQGALERE